MTVLKWACSQLVLAEHGIKRIVQFLRVAEDLVERILTLPDELVILADLGVMLVHAHLCLALLSLQRGQLVLDLVEAHALRQLLLRQFLAPLLELLHFTL